jgi:hypothetical protein
MPGHIKVVQPTLLKQFFAIELHLAVYLSFIAININVFLSTIAHGARSRLRRLVRNCPQSYKPKASYTIEADDLKQVIVER